LIADVAALAGNEDLSADLAVVGAGPAGIVTALEVASRGFDVLLVESGQRAFNPEIQQLAEAAEWDRQRHSPMSMAVRRQLGGTSVIWGGKCVPLDPVDFDHRSFISASAWPVSYGELFRYFQRACDWMACGRAVFETTSMRHLPSTLVPGLSDGEVRASSLERWSLPTNFGRAYRHRLSRSARVRVITGLTCTEVSCRPGEQSVDHLECKSLDGKHVRVRARAYVLAAGGLESTRLLLASKGPAGAPLGDHSGHLGSWYMSHVEGVIANVRFFTDPRRTVFGYERDIDGTYVRRRLTVTPGVQHKLDLPNVAAWLANPELADPRHRNAVLSFVYLTLRSPLGRIVSPDAQRLSMTGEDVPGSPYGGAEKGPAREHLKNIALGSASAARFAASFGTRRFLARGRRVPGFFVYSPQNLYPFQYHGEQAPNPQSRVTLTNSRDALGMPKLRIDIQFLQQDVDGIVRTHQLWDDYLRRRGCGRLEYTSEDPAAAVRSRIGGAFHQLGTTRMAELPENGVVDKSLAVHGVRNLFVASSSVFVTSGQANPTFTIVVLALRLADRLGSVLREL
jgi:choline dehydrogenase-like flavoprotein